MCLHLHVFAFACVYAYIEIEENSFGKQNLHERLDKNKHVRLTQIEFDMCILPVVDMFYALCYLTKVGRLCLGIVRETAEDVNLLVANVQNKVALVSSAMFE